MVWVSRWQRMSFSLLLAFPSWRKNSIEIGNFWNQWWWNSQRIKRKKRHWWRKAPIIYQAPSSHCGDSCCRLSSNISPLTPDLIAFALTTLYYSTTLGMGWKFISPSTYTLLWMRTLMVIKRNILGIRRFMRGFYYYSMNYSRLGQWEKKLGIGRSTKREEGILKNWKRTIFLLIHRIALKYIQTLRGMTPHSATQEKELSKWKGRRKKFFLTPSRALIPP